MSDIVDQGLFIVENAVNTCYIDSLLMSLFYSPSTFQNILQKDCGGSNSNAGLLYYLQEYILNDFVFPVRGALTIKEDTMNMIRTLCIQCGWRSDAITETDIEEYIKQQDVTEFYTFLCEKFEVEPIEIQRKTIIQGDQSEKEEIGEIEKVPFIPLSIPTGRDKIGIKDLLDLWMHDNQISMKRLVNNKEETVIGLTSHFIVNMPSVIALGLNRFKSTDGKRDETDIYIAKKIIPLVQSIQPKAFTWVFHAAICHRGASLRQGHYYALLQHEDRYYLFDDLQEPCLVEVSMTDPAITKMVKKECVFMLYRYDS